MNILYLCDEYPPGQHGGIGTSVRSMARELVKQGHRVVVAGLYSPGYGGADEFVDNGVKVYRFRRQLDAAWFKDQQSLLTKAGNKLLKATGLTERDIKKSLAIYQSKLEELIAKHQIDIVEMPDYNDYIRFCDSFIPFPKLPVPVVVKLNGSITYFESEAKKPVAENIIKVEQAILNQAAAVSAASRYVAEKTAVYLSYSKKIEVLYNGIDTELETAGVEKNFKQVIFTGTLVAKKGIYQLASAWNIVNKSLPDARLLVLGKGPQEKVISCLNKEAGKTMTFLGNVTTEKLYTHLSASAVAVFPSYAEAFALAPLEAMACGTTVINSNRTSGPELIDDQIDGLLINPDDTDQMAASIIYLLTHTEVCKKLGEKGREKVRKDFDISGIAIQTVQFYQKMLNNID